MRMYDIIRKKRDREELSEEEINFFVRGIVTGEIPDYQASALCMAIFLNGMTLAETRALTFAIRDSGAKADFSAIRGIRADKHSTGGVGDKTSLVVAPIVASLGLKVAKISGRGLGHTGGTIDKLESIEGFNTTLSEEQFIDQVNEVGVAIIGQSSEFAPADKKLYALRDVTATVDCLPLIVSSIMGKKLAADDDVIVLDVKTGSGSFNKTVEVARELADIMVGIGKDAGKKILALITDMDIPLGNAIGNSLEVIESVQTLQGNGPEDFTYICKELSKYMLYLAGYGTEEQCLALVNDAISSGKALNTLKAMVAAQGGRVELIENPSLFTKAKYVHEVKSPSSGYITGVNTEGYGIASLLLGAGRNTIEDEIDYSAGIILNAKTGDKVEKGQTLAYLYTNDKQRIDGAENKFLQSTYIGEKQIKTRPLILEIIK